MLRTVKILLLNPDLQMVYLVIGKASASDLKSPGQTALKLLEEEKIDLILCPPAVPLPTDEEDEALEQGRLTL